MFRVLYNRFQIFAIGFPSTRFSVRTRTRYWEKSKYYFVNTILSM